MSEFYCKYLKKKIELELCIDINMVRSDGIKEEVLGNLVEDFDKKCQIKIVKRVNIIHYLTQNNKSLQNVGNSIVIDCEVYNQKISI